LFPFVKEIVLLRLSCLERCYTLIAMKIIVQKKRIDKHTNEVVEEEVSLDNEYFEGHSNVLLTIGDARVELRVADLFAAVEAFQRYGIREDDEQVRVHKLERP
jgi:predicted transcriptional regulator